MPSGIIIHAAVFTAGAVLGGGIAAVVSNKNRVLPVPAAAVPTGPIIGVETIGKAPAVLKDLSVTSVTQSLPLALKYGHPGAPPFLFMPFEQIALIT